MTMVTELHLKIHKIDQYCLFDLRWGNGQHLPTQRLAYPIELNNLYQLWRDKYLDYYDPKQQQVSHSKRGATNLESPGIKTVATGHELKATNPHTNLVNLEEELLLAFQNWLKSEVLFEIRNEIISAVQRLRTQNSVSPSNYVSLFLTCSPEVEKLPWESWEMTRDVSISKRLRILRVPTQIKNDINVQKNKRKYGRSRVLAILGDDSSLNLEKDKLIISSLSKVAELELISQGKGEIFSDWKDRICKTLIHEKGWDILFFSGHSKESILMGGEVIVSPQTSITLREIEHHITVAKNRGLKFAIFNSCSGLDIANTLIDMGLSQVAVMREQIHDQVAQEFLTQFVKGIGEYKDVYEAFLDACHYLRDKESLKYPSAHLIPSLYSRPGAVSFRLEPLGFRLPYSRLLPNRHEMLILGTFFILGLVNPVQDTLLDLRISAQAIYRDITGQIPKELPSISLVQIDEESLFNANIKQRNPLDRSYIAQLIQKLARSGKQMIAVDYVLDRPQIQKDAHLASVLKMAIAKQSVWFVFATIPRERKVPRPEIVNSKWSLQGNIELDKPFLSAPLYLKLPSTSANCDHTCSFAYWSAIAASLIELPVQQVTPQPKLSSDQELYQQLLEFMNHNSPQSQRLSWMKNAQLSPISNFFTRNTWLFWLVPIHDFSIPTTNVFEQISASELLRGEKQPNHPIVILAPGGYHEAGVNEPGEDNYPQPFAIQYWMHESGQADSRKMTGGEVHAYSLYHLLKQSFVIPIPDLWIVAIAGLLGKGFTLLQFNSPKSSEKWGRTLAGTTVIYGLISLQMYISAMVVLPWLMPSIVFWLYVLPSLQRKSHG